MRYHDEFAMSKMPRIHIMCAMTLNDATECEICTQKTQFFKKISSCFLFFCKLLI